ncbi:MAG TPA: hypothetical protein VGI19_03840 [Candidatus Cybelea sp.]
MNRAFFLRSSAAAAIACGFLREVAFGAEPSVGVAGTLEALIETILPFGARGVAFVTPAAIAARLNELYALDQSPQFVASLAAFADVGAFPAGSKSLFEIEAAQSALEDIGALTARDGQAFRAAGLPMVSFDELGARERAEYLRLWQQSAFNARRRFYVSVRAVAMSALYSLPQSWPAIGYAGPMLQPRSHT